VAVQREGDERPEVQGGRNQGLVVQKESEGLAVQKEGEGLAVQKGTSVHEESNHWVVF
jgi:hypothetical protein